MSARWFAFWLNVPTLLCLGAILAYPICYAAYLSVHRVGLAQLRRGEFPFTGWENYSRVLSDPLFFVAIKNTLIFTVVTVGSEIVLAVAIALLINQAGIWTSRVTRLLILLPYAIPPIANGLIWTFLYSFQFGYLNRILFSAGLISEPVNWAGEPATALYAVSVPYVWRTLPFAIILVHAALQGIPRELYEQAAIDG
ncbi:MAG TPA: sugar ABC transporter permease, partial [Reyranella sp.]